MGCFMVIPQSYTLTKAHHSSRLSTAGFPVPAGMSPAKVIHWDFRSPGHRKVSVWLFLLYMLSHNSSDICTIFWNIKLLEIKKTFNKVSVIVIF